MVCEGWQQRNHADGDLKGCSETISSEWAGYCKCKGGWIAMKKESVKGDYSTCNEACSGELLTYDESKLY